MLDDGQPVAGDRGGGVLLLASMRGTRWLGRGLQVLRLSRLIDALDALLARSRKWMGKLVPDGASPERYP